MCGLFGVRKGARIIGRVARCGVSQARGDTVGKGYATEAVGPMRVVTIGKVVDGRKRQAPDEDANGKAASVVEG